MTWPRAAIAKHLAETRGSATKIIDITPLSGGAINQAARLDTTDGPLFVKWNRSPLEGLFSAEAAGLGALARSDSRLYVPEIVAHRDPGEGEAGFLVTELLDETPRGPDFDEQLGLGLAELHATTRNRFGFDTDNYIGAIPQPNPATDTWVAFYRDHRLAHQVQLARNAGHLSAAETAACDRLCQRLGDLLPESRPSLLHGDLWAGNLMSHQGRPAIIDPATYFGHPEAELGMMTLFGGFGPGCTRCTKKQRDFQRSGEHEIRSTSCTIC